MKKKEKASIVECMKILLLEVKGVKQNERKT